MGRLMGFHHLPTGGYVEADQSVAMPLEEWNKVVAYYIAKAPEHLSRPAGKADSIITGLNQFTAIIPVSPVIKPSTTLVSINPAEQTFSWGDGVLKRIYRANANGLLLDSFNAEVGVVQIHEDSAAVNVLNMGVLYPSDEGLGSLVEIQRNKKHQQPVVVLDSLIRPVHASYVDLNFDNLEDIIICEFGNKIGKLSWYQRLADNTFLEHHLNARAGAVRTIPGDYDKDGRLDVLALMAQGDEGVFIYYNQGNGNFREQVVLKFPPSFGCNYIEVLDYNNDGLEDLLITNGDNGDYPPLLKPYHGIRLYLNNGSNKFSEKLFLQINGVGKALAKDFDADGDVDIVSISYFPDYNRNPGEGFVYWQNTGDGSYMPYTFPEVSAGRWLTMEAGDVDADGDIDILLGNAYFSLGYIPLNFKKQWDKYSPSVILLKNTLH